jgi:hypothetical protein
VDLAPYAGFVARATIEHLNAAEDGSWGAVLLPFILEDAPGFRYDWTGYPHAKPPTSKLWFEVDLPPEALREVLARRVQAVNGIAERDPLGGIAKISVEAARITPAG